MVSSAGRDEPNGAFADRVVRVVGASGPGEVLTYGEVAAEAGRPGAARAVGRVLRDSEVPLPWWRVVTATGRLVPGAEERHADHLEAEGVAVDRARGRLARSGRGRPDQP